MSLATAAVGVVLFIPTGCDMEEIIKVPLSPRVHRMTGAGPAVTLRQAPDVFQQFVEISDQEARTLAGTIERKQWWAGFFSSLGDVGLSLAADAGEASFPGLGGLIAGLTAAAGGLFVRRPGDSRRMSEAESESQRSLSSLREQNAAALKEQGERSYNRGRRDAEGAIKSLAPLIGTIGNSRGGQDNG